MPQASSVQMQHTINFTQPATATVVVTATATTAVPFASNPPITVFSQTQQRSTYCVTCTPLGKQCPMTYHMPLNRHLSDLEEENEDFNCNRQKEKELKEQELENKNLIEPQMPQYQSMFTTDTDDTILAPEYTDTLVPTTEEKQEEEQTEEGDTENNSKADYSLDNILDDIV